MHRAWAYLIAKQALYQLSYGPIEFSLGLGFYKSSTVHHLNYGLTLAVGTAAVVISCLASLPTFRPPARRTVFCQVVRTPVAPAAYP